MEGQFGSSQVATDSLRPRSWLARYFRKFLGQERVVCGGPPWKFAPREWVTAFVGSFVAIAALGLYSQYGVERAELLGIMPSMGATAVLLYAVPESPLSQPRNVFGGSLMSAVLGLLFQRLTVAAPELRWLAGALAVSLSVVAMMLTKTVHPPAGATALFIATSASPLVISSGWWVLLVLVAVGMLMMMAVAVIVDNVFLTYPKYWI